VRHLAPGCLAQVLEADEKGTMHSTSFYTTSSAASERHTYVSVPRPKPVVLVLEAETDHLHTSGMAYEPESKISKVLWNNQILYIEAELLERL